MFACLYLPPPVRATAEKAPGTGLEARELIQLARDFSPRIETYGSPGETRAVTVDISGLGSLLGDARAIGDELRRTAADRGLRLHIAMASTTTAAILLAVSRAGLTIVPPGGEPGALASLPLAVLESCAALMTTMTTMTASARQAPPPGATGAPDVAQLRRWGLRTLGDLAALPAGELSARLGQDGLRWQRWARGEDARPLVPAGVEERFEESLDLEWPIDGLEPLSFVLARLFDPLCERLERRDRGAVVLRVDLTLVDKQLHQRVLELPAPMRDARVLRTLALLDLESHPPSAAIDRVRVAVEVVEGRMLQFGLFARALPTDKLATLMARLGALMGRDRVGAPALVDSYRPGAFTMATFAPEAAPGSPTNPDSRIPRPTHALRRFRSPIPARVTLEQGHPVRVATDRRGFSGGNVERCDGPWRSSGDWWQVAPWNCDEWDVALSDGAMYRLAQARDGRGQWFVAGMID